MALSAMALHEVGLTAQFSTAFMLAHGQDCCDLGCMVDNASWQHVCF